MHTSNLCKTAEERIRAEDMKGLSMSMSMSTMSTMSMPGLGVHVIDRFTYHVLEFFEKLKPESANTMGELEASLTPDKLMSRAVLDVKTFTHRNARAMKLSEFFGAVCKTRALTGAFDWFVGAKSTADAPVVG
jgi:GPI-anchor transamidase subunit K